MERKFAFTFIGAFLAFWLLTGTQTSSARHRHHRHHHRRHTVAVAKIAMDSCASDEIAQLSSMLGVQLDTCCDTKLMLTLAGWLGTPYHHAGYSKKGIDCSGFVSKIYKDVYGLDLTHSACSMITQMHECVNKDELREGDVLFFKIHGKRSRISHVGIYLKNNKFIHASSYRGIVVEDLTLPYYKQRFYKAGRVM